MNRSKLAHFLNLLQREEVNRFTSFLHSPFFNKRTEPRQFFAAIQKQLLRRNKPFLNVPLAYQKAFPGQPTGNVRYRKLCSELLGLLWDFWAHQDLERDPVKKRIALLQELNVREEKKYFPGLYQSGRADLAARTPVRGSHFEDAYELEQAYGLHLKNVSARAQDLNLDNIRAAVNDSYRLRSLLLDHSESVVAKVYGTPAPAPTPLKAPSENDHFLIRLYHILYQVGSRPNWEEGFFRLKADFFQYRSRMHIDEKNDFFVSLVNFALRQINSGNDRFTAELFQLFQRMVEEGIAMVDGKMQQPFFKNFVSLGCRLGEFDYVEGLIEDFGGRLAGGKTDNALQFNRGILAFYKSDFDACTKHLYQVMSDLDDVFYGLDARAFLLRAFYYQQDLSGMEALSHSFRMYLERGTGISERHKRNFGAFIRFFRRLYQLGPREFGKMKRLREDILAEKAISGKAWLLGELEELEAD